MKNDWWARTAKPGPNLSLAKTRSGLEMGSGSSRRLRNEATRRRTPLARVLASGVADAVGVRWTVVGRGAGTSHRVGISRVGGASGGASFVAMVQATDLGQLDHHPGLWRRHRARVRGVLDEGQMGSGAVVVGEVACENPAKMALAKDDYVVETFAADGSDQALDEGVLPRGPRGAHDDGDEECEHSAIMHHPWNSRAG